MIKPMETKHGPGRPRLPEGDRLSAGFFVALKPSEHAAFKAACEGKPMASVARSLLLSALADSEKVK